jgi:hypothetical protein
LAYSGSQECEGAVWLPLSDTMSVIWKSNSGRALLDLPNVSAPALNDQPLTSVSKGAALCSAKKLPSGVRPKKSPPYRVFTENRFDASYFPVQYRANTENDVDVLICVEEVKVTVERCAYEKGHTLIRIRSDTIVRLIDYKAGTLFVQQTFYGGAPSYCPAKRGFANITDTTGGTSVDPQKWVDWVMTFIRSNKPTRTITAGGTNVYAEPSSQSKVVGKLASNTPVNIIGRDQKRQWVVVLLPDMSKGWLPVGVLRLGAGTDIASCQVVSGPATAVAVPIDQ